jgi:hypothetical protein
LRIFGEKIKIDISNYNFNNADELKKAFSTVSNDIIGKISFYKE